MQIKDISEGKVDKNGVFHIENHVRQIYKILVMFVKCKILF
jgi:hypothetical protein